jgi:hypothetical protein
VSAAFVAATLMAVGCGVSSNDLVEGTGGGTGTAEEALSAKLDTTKVSKLIGPMGRKEKLGRLQGHRPTIHKQKPAAPKELLANKGQLKLKSADAGSPDVAPSPQLTYYGGQVLDKPEVYVVTWGKDIPESTRHKLRDYFKAEVGNGSPTMSMLSEYNTPTQKITFGEFKGVVVDEDAPPLASVTDQQIEAELSRLVDTWKLPTNVSGNKLFMVYFPPGVLPNGACTQYCAYHSTYTRNNRTLYYGVMPDLSANGCELGCGPHADPVDNLLSVSSHEMVEAITDPGVGLAFDYAPPLGWYDANNGEISDICQIFPDAVERGYPMSRQWSNAGDSCATHTPAQHIKISVSPAWPRLAEGGSVQYTVTATGDAGASAKLLASSPWFNGINFAFSQSTIQVGEAVTMTVTAAPGSFSTWWPLYVIGVDNNGDYHPSTPSIDLDGPAPVISGLDVTTGPGEGGTPVLLKGFNFSDVASVTVDGADASALWDDPTQMELIMPAHLPGTADITVTNYDGKTVTLPHAFTYGNANPMTIQGIYPGFPNTASTDGDLVCFAGSAIQASSTPDFVYTSPTVTVNGQASPVLVAWQGDATYPGYVCILTNPGAQPGPADVVVTGLDGQTVSVPSAFTFVQVQQGAPSPAIDSLWISAKRDGDGDDDDYVTIFGSNFDVTPAPTVKFGGKSAQVLSRNPGFLGVIAPKHAKGTVDVVVTNSNGQKATLAGGYTY